MTIIIKIIIVRKIIQKQKNNPKIDKITKLIIRSKEVTGVYLEMDKLCK